LIRRLAGSALVLLGIASCTAHTQTPAVNGVSLTTQDRKDDPGWWPTKGDAPRSQYVGSETCAGCHGRIAALQQTTPMFHAGARATDALILKAQPQLTFREPAFSFSLTRNAAGVTFFVTDGTRQSTVPVVWAFGAGEYGQTYILQKNGTYTESRVSYYTSLKALDITPGQSNTTTQGVEDALGKKLDNETTASCFQCHTSEAVTAGVLNSDKAIPGVTCESCHGPGAKHVAAMRDHDDENSPPTIMNPKYLSASDSVDFCGACHRTWSDVAMGMPTNMGAAKVRFQPYRLEMSRCWGAGVDARITCIACHDPHQPLVHELSAYDAKCLACHSGAKGSTTRVSSKTCNVGTSRCASCHMPKVEVPEAHAAFTDHFIRVVHSNEPEGRKLSQ
jgi:hypothetical protein